MPARPPLGSKPAPRPLASSSPTGTISSSPSGAARARRPARVGRRRGRGDAPARARRRFRRAPRNRRALVDGGPWSMSDEPVADLLELAQDVRRDEYGAPARRRPTDEVAHLVDPGRIEAVGRLVQDEQRGIAQKGGCDAQALLHPERVVTERSEPRASRPTSASTSRFALSCPPRRPGPAGSGGQ